MQEVVTVPDGMAALEYIESSEKPPDLLVTDMMSECALQHFGLLFG